MTFRCSAGELTEDLQICERKLTADQIGMRLKAFDHTIWSLSPKEIANRLGWLNLPVAMSTELEPIQRIVTHARSIGLTDVLLVGMGGSSLAPEVFSQVIGTRPGYLRLRVLDSIHPDAVNAAVSATPPAKTLVIVSTKSGASVETVSLFRYLYTWLVRKLGRIEARIRTVVITDPTSIIEQEARSLGVGHIVHGNTEVGGRYSALSVFGLVPAALMGANIRGILETATIEAEQPIEMSPGFQLGALLGTAALTGRDKLSLRSSPRLAPLGAWIEQLVAESTGKQGLGIVPINRENEMTSKRFPKDRLFAFHHYNDELLSDMEPIRDAGQPMAECILESAEELGAIMYRWQLATAIAGAVMGINPFDQPDVEKAKQTTRNIIAEFRKTGELSKLTQTTKGNDLTLYGPLFSTQDTDNVNEVELSVAIDAFLRTPTSYLALNAFLSPNTATDTSLERLRQRIQKQYGTVTVWDYGPRFLHTTGQLHKGDSGRGSFIQLTANINPDLPIPDKAGTVKSWLSFGVLLQAQSLGDRQALLDGGRRVICVGLGSDPIAGLDALAAMVD